MISDVNSLWETKKIINSKPFFPKKSKHIKQIILYQV